MESPDGPSSAAAKAASLSCAGGGGRGGTHGLATWKFYRVTLFHFGASFNTFVQVYSMSESLAGLPKFGEHATNSGRIALHVL